MPTKERFFIALILLQSTYDAAYIASVMVQNAPFIFVVVCGGFGVIFGVIRAKARGAVINFANVYSAFFSFIILVIISVFGYYRLQWDVLLLAFGVAIIGVLIDGIVTKFLTQFEEAPTFMAILRVIGESISAVRGVINKAKGDDQPPTS